MSGLGRNLWGAAAVVVPLMQPGVPNALLDQTDLAPAVKESAITLVEGVYDALDAGLEGAREGKDAATAEPPAKPEFSETSPPPPGSTWQATITDSLGRPATPEPQLDWDAEPAERHSVAAASTPEPMSATTDESATEPEPASTPDPLVASRADVAASAPGPATATTPEPTTEPEPEPEPELSC